VLQFSRAALPARPREKHRLRSALPMTIKSIFGVCPADPAGAQRAKAVDGGECDA